MTAIIFVCLAQIKRHVCVKYPGSMLDLKERLPFQNMGHGYLIFGMPTFEARVKKV